MSGGASLAYVLWHWRHPSVLGAHYEARQQAFHSALAERSPDGFSHSISSAIAGAPWANGGGDACQDRYFIRDAAALDALDAWVVRGGARQRAHDGAAAGAAGGVAGLYRVRLGVPLAVPRRALWFAKAAGQSYDEIIAHLAPFVRDGESVLWMRRLVLGPTPEFCLESVAVPECPPPQGARTLELRPVWPADAEPALPPASAR